MKQNPVTSTTLYLITPDFEGNEKAYLDRLKRVLEYGIRLIQFRSKNLPNEHYLLLAQQVIRLCQPYEATIVLNADQDTYQQTQASGLHLTSKQLMACQSRPISTEQVLSVACHNEEQLRQAEAIQADFAVLCPVLKTPSSPQGIPMGWQRFKVLAESTSVPVFALGGLGPTDLAMATEHGAVGVAAKRALWNV